MTGARLMTGVAAPPAPAMKSRVAHAVHENIKSLQKQCK